MELQKQQIVITLKSDIKNISSSQEEILQSYCTKYSNIERILFNYLKDKEKPYQYSNTLQREYIRR